MAMLDQARAACIVKVQHIIDGLRAENAEYSDKEAYQDDFRQNVIIIEGLEGMQKRQEGCVGCMYEKSRKMYPLTVNSACQHCVRYPVRTDMYKKRDVNND